jgi:effector protein HopAB
MGRLAGSGIETSRIAAAIDDTVLRGRALPDEIQGALRRAGIETHVGSRQVPINHPLLQLRREIHAATPEERDPSPPRAERMPMAARRPPRLGIPPIGTSRPPGPDANAARARLIMPDRAERETNAEYAWRLHNLNPGASLNRIAAAAVGETARFNLRPTRLQLDAMIKTRDEFRAAYSGLRPISKADAERIGFKDAQTHGEDEATQCLFGAPLSMSDPDQRVIAFASEPLDQTKPYRAEDMKGFEFMDFNALTTHLATKPVHPSNRAPLDATNIRDYAFRIE